MKKIVAYTLAGLIGLIAGTSYAVSEVSREVVSGPSAKEGHTFVHEPRTIEHVDDADIITASEVFVFADVRPVPPKLRKRVYVCTEERDLQQGSGRVRTCEWR